MSRRARSYMKMSFALEGPVRIAGCSKERMPFWVRALLLCTLIRASVTVTFPATVKIGHIYCDVRLEQAAIALNESVKKLKMDGVVPGSTNFEFLSARGCDDLSALNATIWLVKDERVDVILGPESSGAMSISALLASLRNTPIFGYVSVSEELSNKTKYNTLIRTAFGVGSLGEAIGTLLNLFKWTTVALIRSNKTECTTGVSGIYNVFRNTNLTLKAEIVAVTPIEIDEALDTVRSVARIIILCYGNEPASSNGFLTQAYSKGMINPEYVYIIPCYMRTDLDTAQSDIPWRSSAGNYTIDEELMHEVYRRVIVIQATGEEPSTLEKFEETVVRQAAELHLNTSVKLLKKEPLYLPMLHDCLYTYGVALNHTLSQGVTGWVTIDNSSDRYGDYDVWAMNNVNEYDRMLSIEAMADDVTGDLTQTVEGWNEELFSPMPSDTPLCGFNGEHCTRNRLTEITSGLVAAIGIAIIASIFFVYYRKRKQERDLFKMLWKLKLADVKFMVTATSNSNSLRSVGMSSFTTDSVDTKVTMENLPDTDFKAIASVKGIPAYAKCWQRIKQGQISLDRNQLLLLKQMKEVQHDNLNNFLGAILDDGPALMVFWKHCAKRSLYDLVMNEDVNLDQIFAISIVNDIISGLDYMHNKCPLRYHGNLSITNCLVDSRWVVKLTDFGWLQLHEFLAEQQGYLQPKLVNVHRLYHCAPEILRLMDAEAGSLQTQLVSMPSVDIYSFSMIIYHVLFRIEPYSDCDTEHSVLLQRIRQSGPNPTRPAIPMLPTMYGLVTIMQTCWVEDARRRPSVKEIKRAMYSYYGKILKRSLMDHVISLLEKYATNLEKVVEDRTQQLELERKRADQLLYQMLPKSVAEMLKSGQAVEPETYECVTVYFSDIVGFTELSSISTPIQIVAMLNSLYSNFDETIQLHDVYKVETIGDAYMVVSGLPRRNGLKHVFEICDMALSLLNVVCKFEVAHMPTEQLEIRIGIHSGPVAAGVVASKIHISQQTRDLVVQCGLYGIELRGELDIKGKGLCTTHWLLEKRNSTVGIYERVYKGVNQPD